MLNEDMVAEWSGPNLGEGGGGEPLTVLTNSAKFAHYAPSLLNDQEEGGQQETDKNKRRVRFASLSACVRAAFTGACPLPPKWVEEVKPG
mmetsp:Transcript_13759/g.28202  ORF Transcript_13759/g.28202 Transcript_13759/m.28202 type:complete len:90 (+) Transcript_13759:234-503(+)